MSALADLMIELCCLDFLKNKALNSMGVPQACASLYLYDPYIASISSLMVGDSITRANWTHADKPLIPQTYHLMQDEIVGRWRISCV